MSAAPSRAARPRPGSATATILYILIGPVLWALHFGFVYGAHTLRCTEAVAGTPVPVGGRGLPILVVAATLVALAILGVAILRPESAARALRVDRVGERGRFTARAMVALAVLSALGIAWAGAAPLMLASCAA